jgi:hypothetical protein
VVAGKRPLARQCVEPGPADTGTQIFDQGEDY